MYPNLITVATPIKSSAIHHERKYDPKRLSYLAEVKTIVVSPKPKLDLYDFNSEIEQKPNEKKAIKKENLIRREGFDPCREREKVVEKENKKMKLEVASELQRGQRTRPFLDRTNKSKTIAGFFEPAQELDITPKRECEVGIEASF